MDRGTPEESTTVCTYNSYGRPGVADSLVRQTNLKNWLRSNSTQSVSQFVRGNIKLLIRLPFWRYLHTSEVSYEGFVYSICSDVV